MAILVTCVCGKQFKVKDELAGKRGKCAACGKVVAVPAPAPPVEPENAAPAAQRTCPKCRAGLQPKAVICVRCGLDLRTGKQLVKTDAPANEAEKQPAAPAWLGIALVAAGLCLTGAVAAAYLIPWGAGPDAKGEAKSKPVLPGPADTSNLSFEEAFRAGHIAWLPLKNARVATKLGNQLKVEAFEMTTKFKHDADGKKSIDTTGEKPYSFPDREVTFGPGAVIRVGQDVVVRDGAIQTGAEWTWTGEKWAASQGPPVAGAAPTLDPLEVRDLLSKVRNITPAHVAGYEQFLREPTFLNATMYQGLFPYTGDDVKNLVRLGHEKPAVASLIKLVQERKGSASKGDLLVCSQAIKTLGHFGPHAKDAAPLMAELQNSKDNAVGSEAKLALGDIQGKMQPTGGEPASPAVAWAAQMGKKLEGRRFQEVDLLKRAGAKMPPDIVKLWKAALEPATGEKLQGIALLQVILRYSPIWKGEEFLPTESQRYAGRTGQTPREQVGRWRDGFAAATGDRTDELQTVLLLIQMDYLYDAERFRDARAAQLLPRLRSLSPELLQPWAEALRCTRLEAAIELIDNDWLFDNDRLKIGTADEALRVLRTAGKPGVPAGKAPS